MHFQHQVESQGHVGHDGEELGGGWGEKEKKQKRKRCTLSPWIKVPSREDLAVSVVIMQLREGCMRVEK